MTTALIIVDVQNDFCEGGALAVLGGKKVAQDIADYLWINHRHYDLVVTTQDFHNPLPDTNGGHFSENPDYVDSWPVHCVSGTYGAELSDKLDFPTGVRSRLYHVFKGQGIPAYSGFEGRTENKVSMVDLLDDHNILEVHVVGLALDFCVTATARSSARLGFVTSIITDLTAAVSAPTLVAALPELDARGAHVSLVKSSNVFG